MAQAPATAALARVIGAVEGRHGVPLVLRPNPRAQRLVLRLDRARRCLTLTYPPRLAARHVDTFLTRSDAWIREQVAALPAAPTDALPAEIPLRGAAHAVVPDPSLGRRVVAADGEIRIGGAAEFAPSRLLQFLKDSAKADIVPLADALAAKVERRVAAVSLRDTRSRWGSCSADGRLSFCWRLVMAPPAVLDYVVAHEVAHLVHMNHAPAFWALNRALAQDIDGACAWLKRHGSGLHLILPAR